MVMDSANRVLSAYQDDKPYSVELVGAVSLGPRNFADHDPESDYDKGPPARDVCEEDG